MQRFLKWLDEIAVTNQENKTAKWLERIAFFFLILMILSAPHSIAATQTSWIIGMLAWGIRIFIKPRPKLQRTALDIPLWAFFAWSAITSIFSYAPEISIDKLRGVALFLIFYFVINNLRSIRAVKFLSFALIFSTMIVVLWTPIERLIGRGVEIHKVSAQSPLTKALLYEGDAILRANGKKIKNPDDLLSAVETGEKTNLQVYRGDYYFNVDVKKAELINATNSLEKLGFESWKKSRNWRSMGFYGHWTTFAEVLQLVISLIFGLFIASFSLKKADKGEFKNRFPFSFSPLLLFCLTAGLFALLLNSTRASQLGFLVSAFAVVFLVKRKMLLILAAIILPIALAGFFVFQNTIRPSTTDSDKYRQTVYREGFDLWTENPRHFLVGVGMDSIKKYAKDWRLFDNGKLPQGHFHSTPLQLVVERGLPALLLWLWILFVYLRTLLRKLSGFNDDDSWKEKGIILGIFGGAVGFFTSGLVHYNLGDAEVAMIFFILMAFGVFLANPKSET